MIGRATVLHVARLARLGLSEDEIDGFAAQLSAIVGFVEQVAAAAAVTEPPPAHRGPSRLRLRADEVTGSMPRDEALANAPSVEAGYLRVPAVFD
jgi:aspartyl-tRNA(Asn)/glutamyl-tRNA(Gln) amidotransferase subunit C